MDDKVIKSLRQIVEKHAPHVDLDSLKPDQELTGMGIDSLSFIEVIFDVENQFGIEISDEQLSSMKTIQDLAESIRTLKEEKKHER